MTHNHIARRVALGLLLAGAAIPVAAQETQPVTPPSVTPPAATAPAEPATPAPAPAASPSIQFAPQSPVVQTQLPPPPPADSVREPAAERTTTRSATRSSSARSTVAQRAAPAAAAPAAAAPAPAAVTPAPAPEPVAAAPAPAPEAAVSPAAEADQTATDQASTTTSTDSSGGLLMWAPILLGGLIILGLIGFLMARRRRTNEAVYEEPYYTQPEESVAAAPAAAFVEEPVAAAPIVEDARRPWIDVGLRPIRAGATDDGAQVELELTVSNSGDRAARDVRVSTWMLADAHGTDNEQALIDARTNAQTAAFDLAPGADRSVDTTLDLPRAAVNGSFRPLVVAEARYPLPDGTEGRIAATFEVGRGEEVAPIATDGMHEDVGARLHEVLERS